jgi:hypothetical protein
MIALIRSKVTYANVTATVALFVALGGVGYAAATLPRNSVGSAQIRPKAIGKSELRKGAVTSRTIRNRAVRLTDISRSARRSLRGTAGPQGPAGPAAVTYRAAITSGGAQSKGNSQGAVHATDTNEYRVEFANDVSGCIYTATLAAVQSGPTLEQPQPGRITVASDSDSKTRVLVRTYAANGTAAEQPFHVIVAC